MVTPTDYAKFPPLKADYAVSYAQVERFWPEVDPRLRTRPRDRDAPLRGQASAWAARGAFRKPRACASTSRGYATSAWRAFRCHRWSLDAVARGAHLPPAGAGLSSPAAATPTGIRTSTTDRWRPTARWGCGCRWSTAAGKWARSASCAARICFGDLEGNTSATNRRSTSTGSSPASASRSIRPRSWWRTTAPSTWAGPCTARRPTVPMRCARR